MKNVTLCFLNNDLATPEYFVNVSFGEENTRRHSSQVVTFYKRNDYAFLDGDNLMHFLYFGGQPGVYLTITPGQADAGYILSLFLRAYEMWYLVDCGAVEELLFKEKVRALEQMAFGL